MKYLKMIALISLFIFSGCSSFEPIIERGENMIDTTQDMIRSTDRLARSTERLSDQTAETARSVKRLKKQRTCVEVKNASTEYDTFVRLIGTDQRELLNNNEYVRFNVPVERFAEEHVFTVEMDVYTKDGRPVRPAPQEVRNNFSSHELTDKGCGILYFTTEDQRITGLKKPSEIHLY